jgi:integrase
LKSMSRALARKVLTSLKSLLKDAKRRGNVAQNVASDVSISVDKRSKKKLKIGVDIPTPDEIKRILGTVSGPLRPLLITATFTGMRASELRGLPWKNIDFKRGEAHQCSSGRRAGAARQGSTDAARPRLDRDDL